MIGIIKSFLGSYWSKTIVAEPEPSMATKGRKNGGTLFVLRTACKAVSGVFPLTLQ
jgi:hypothetical protein